jgi:peroxiredoxin Q/BCP
MKYMVVETGKEAPKFCLPDKDENTVCLEKFKGKWVVLYFYPKDNTKACTLEAVTFTGSREEFTERDAVILGVSPDSSESHCKFADKHDLTITLLSDTAHKILETYGVWQKKKMYGKEYWGVVRSTFLIDPEGKVAALWRKVRVKGHVEEVLNTLIEFQEG